MTPNFLIIGAAKAGTSAVWAYLAQHPEVFMHPAKELRFFALDGRPGFQGPGDTVVNTKWVSTWDEYRDCFAGVSADVTAVGEASPFYLCSEGSAERIQRYLPDAKLIAILRDPASRAFSSYQSLRLVEREPLADFRDALEAEDERRRQNWEFLWRYRELGLYSRQLQPYFAAFPREQIWIGLHDDLQEDPAGFVRSIFRFLDVDPDYRVDLSARLNLSGVARSKALHRVMKNATVKSVARGLVPQRYRTRLRSFLATRNVRRAPRPDDVISELRAFYRPEIESLEQLLGRDLSAWKGEGGQRESRASEESLPA